MSLSTEQLASVAQEQDHSQKDAYCYICEDGGNMVDCCWCTNSCCYNIIGQRLDNPTNEPEACVSIPESMASGEDTLFPCPKCVSERGLSSIGYFVNQGARATMRVASRTSVAIIIYHLNAFNAVAKSLSEQLNSALSAFYVSVACQTRLIHRGFSSEEADAMFDEIPRSSPYHLAVIFITEGDPQGGWWHTSNYGSQKDSRVDEEPFLETCLHNLKKMASNALTARVFGVACGFNLKRKGSLRAIQRYLHKTPFLSMVLPSTCSLLMCEYIPLFPEIFVNLYYFGAGLEPTLKRTWGKSKEARVHTGLIIVERSAREYDLSARMLLYAPVHARPLGVPLPLAYTLCGCPDDGSLAWAFKKEIQNPPETIFIYRSTCCKVELQVGIYPDQRRSLSDHEVLFVTERWNNDKGRFTFNESKNVRMKVLPPHPEGKPHPVDLKERWTVAGRKTRKTGI